MGFSKEYMYYHPAEIYQVAKICQYHKTASLKSKELHFPLQIEKNEGQHLQVINSAYVCSSWDITMLSWTVFLVI